MEEIASNAESQVCYCAVDAHDIDKYAINCSVYNGETKLSGDNSISGDAISQFCRGNGTFRYFFSLFKLLKHRWTNLGPEAQFVEARHSFKVDPSFKVSAFLNMMGKKGGKKRERKEN